MLVTDLHQAELLDAYRRLVVAPTIDAGDAFEGWVEFKLQPGRFPEIVDAYRVRIELPDQNSISLPKVFELDRRIERRSENHVNWDGSLCLGAPLQLKRILGRRGTILKYIDSCLVPYLYAASWREQGNVGYPFGELPHNSEGLLVDYEKIFGVVGREKVREVLGLLGERARVACPSSCPCGCGLLLSECEYRNRLVELRRSVPRAFFKKQLDEFRD